MLFPGGKSDKCDKHYSTYMQEVTGCIGRCSEGLNDENWNVVGGKERLLQVDRLEYRQFSQ